MAAPFEYAGNGDVCTGCVEIISRGDMVGPISEDCPEHLLCVACWWLQQCELPLPAWVRGGRWPGTH